MRGRWALNFQARFWVFENQFLVSLIDKEKNLGTGRRSQILTPVSYMLWKQSNKQASEEEWRKFLLLDIWERYCGRISQNSLHGIEKCLTCWSEWKINPYIANPANLKGRDSKTFIKGEKQQGTLSQLTDILENLNLMLTCLSVLGTSQMSFHGSKSLITRIVWD